MPLMSAAKTWSKLKASVADKSLYKDITNLLLAQVILQYLRAVLLSLRSGIRKTQRIRSETIQARLLISVQFKDLL